MKKTSTKIIAAVVVVAVIAAALLLFVNNRNTNDNTVSQPPSQTQDTLTSSENSLKDAIWWGIAAWPVDTFVKANDFSDKNVIPFCTSSSSDLGDSGNLLKEKANGGNWMEGYRFPSSPSSEEITQWTDSLK